MAYLGCELLRHLLKVQLLVVLLKVVVILEFLLRRGALVRLWSQRLVAGSGHRRPTWKS